MNAFSGNREFSQCTTSRRWQVIACFALALLVAGCGGDSKSSSGGGGSAPSQPTGQAPQPVDPLSGGGPNPTTQQTVVGPNLNGNWAGYYKSIEGHYENLTATITQVGANITITTTKKSGVARELKGRINSVGHMLLYDTFDNEDWTTFYGPASARSINLADLVYVGTSLVDTNILILKR